jgi:murein DD-endopeptidase MepM/ murein hydrolase activator NlpD
MDFQNPYSTTGAFGVSPYGLNAPNRQPIDGFGPYPSSVLEGGTSEPPSQDAAAKADPLTQLGLAQLYPELFGHLFHGQSDGGLQNNALDGLASGYGSVSAPSPAVSNDSAVGIGENVLQSNAAGRIPDSHIWPVPGDGNPAVRDSIGANGLKFSDGRYSPGGEYRHGYRQGRWTGLPHYGIDLPATFGDAVYAAADGTVLHSGAAPGWGNYVAIKHADGYISVYAHLSSIAPLRSGDRVYKGDAIARVGQSGNAAHQGTHLHFEVRKDVGANSLRTVSRGAVTVDPTRWMDGDFESEPQR